MKFYRLGIILLFLLSISMGFVCAEDANMTSQDSLQAADLNNDSGIGVKTFTDLSDEISNDSDSINLVNDFKFNNQSDSVKSIVIKNRNLTITGNSHVIDGNGMGSVFEIRNSTVLITDIVFKNCISPIVLLGSTLNTVNVTFENNFNNNFAGAVEAYGSRYVSTNDKFIKNHAKYGSAIYADESNIVIDNAIFKDSKGISWSMIYADQSEVRVSNSVFANSTSRYATAIYNNYKTDIKKSKFLNLFANATGGAIAVKGNDLSNVSVIIEDCEFVNVSSYKNGGALYFDISGSDFCNGSAKISNSTFTSCVSEFGGALLQLGGNLEISDSTFSENAAVENGGAVYLAYVTADITNSIFTDNEVDPANGFGGAVFSDFSKISIDKSTFKNNGASEGGAVYVYDGIYNIINCGFEGNKEALHTYFNNKNSKVENITGDDTFIQNDDDYVMDIRYNGEEIILNPQTIKGSAKDSYFSLKDLGLVTPVRDQGSMGSCWAFGAVGAFESAFLIATNISLDISENNVQNLGLRYSHYGNSYWCEGGSYYTSAAYFMSWLGAVSTPDDDYDELGKISSLKYSPHAYRAVDAIFIDINNRTAIKEALTKYGALNLFIYGAVSNNPYYYNPSTAAVYYYGNGSGNHYVTLVGWNDTFSKSNFVKTPSGDGAWICKNSWGSNWGDEGYFYLSYYDKSLKNSDVVGFIFENNEFYDKLYQNEFAGYDVYNSKYDTYLSLFNSTGGDIIAAVGTYFEKAGTQYKISIYIDDSLVYTQYGKAHHSGYNAVKLNDYVAVDENSTFEIRITSSSVPVLENSRHKIALATSAIIDSDGDAIDLGREDCVAPIKVYTYKASSISNNLFKHYMKNETVFSFFDVEGDSLFISFKGANITVPIENGTGKVNLGVLPVGVHWITVHYKNATFSNVIIVKSTIDTNDVTSTTIGYNTQLTFSAQLLDFDGNPLKNTKATIKFDGKSISGYTDNDGMFPVEIPRGVKVAKHYIDFINPLTGETLKVTVNIVSRFSGNKNVNMYYYDGSTYKVRIRGHDGKFVGKNQVVTITVGKKSYKVKTDASGYAVLKIPSSITPGKYTVKATYFGQTVKNTLTVKQVLKTSKTVSVKKSAKKLTLKATLKKGKTALKYKVVKFKLNGKTYKAKTNKYGVVKLTVKKSVIKKLKAGKKYTVKVSYLSCAVKSTLKVKR